MLNLIQHLLFRFINRAIPKQVRNDSKSSTIVIASPEESGRGNLILKCSSAHHLPGIASSLVLFAMTVKSDWKSTHHELVSSFAIFAMTV